jgi:uncharacterized protein (UPF0332 family)
MTEKSRITTLCLYRMQQAEESLLEMDILKDSGHLRGAINRAYYAMFYAIHALVAQKKAQVSKHSGAISFFDQEFVKTGIVDKRFSKWLHRLFDLRQDADYGSMFEPAENQCDQAMAHAKEFVHHIRKYLDNCMG